MQNSVQQRKVHPLLLLLAIGKVLAKKLFKKRSPVSQRAPIISQVIDLQPGCLFF